MTDTPLRVLVLCTGNSCRSQMMESFLKRYGGDRIQAASAGSQPHGVHPLTIQVMQEVGIDLSGARSKHLSEFLDQPWDYVITVCDHAAEQCPLFPGPAERLHWSFEDPPAAPEAQRLATFRRVRDEIAAQARQWVEATFPATPTEIEAKYRALQPIEVADVEALDFAPYRLGPLTRHDLHDRVLDTEDLRIFSQHHVLRVRQDGERVILTLKGPLTIEEAVHRVAEWETFLTSPSPTDPGTWPQEFQARLRELAEDAPVRVQIQTRNQRRTWPLLRGATVVGEVALDAGTIQAGEGTLPFHEMEVELKGEGTESDLQAVMEILSAHLPLEPEPRSKAQRGFALLRGNSA